MIFDFAFNDPVNNLENYLPERIKEAARNCLNMARINKASYYVAKNKLSDLKFLYNVSIKYAVYQDVYRDGIAKSPNNVFGYVNPKNPPILGEILSIGFSWLYQKPLNIRQFSKVKETEIEKIVELVPESLDCDVFKARPGDFTAFQVGCLNECIPIKMIKLLLEAKANPDSHFMDKPYILKLKGFCFRDHIITAGRYCQIYELFVQYGLDESLHEKARPDQLSIYQEPEIQESVLDDNVCDIKQNDKKGCILN